jgi:hypothetical protein
VKDFEGHEALIQEMGNGENRLLLSKVIGYLIPISELLNTDAKMVLCPFHVDSRPSAKIYSDDEDGIERLFCYSCRRSYTSYNLLKDRSRNPLRVLFDNFPDGAIRAAIDAVKEGIEGKDFFGHYPILEKDAPPLSNLDEFLCKIYNVEGH